LRSLAIIQVCKKRIIVYIRNVDNQPLQITHISYSNSGGAGAVARRLRRYQLENLGIESKFLYVVEESLRNNPFLDPITSLAAVRDEYFVKKDLRGPMLSLYRNRTNQKILNELFNSTNILHLHWVNGVISFFDFTHKSISSKKVIWTMHDMEPFTGGCHHALSCDNFKSVCAKCPLVHKVYGKKIENQHHRKIEYLGKLKNIKFVTPSNWLKLRAQKSTLLKNEQINVISNPVDEIYFENKIKIELKDRVYNEIIVGFVSTDLDSPLKNYKTLKIIIKKLNEISENKFRILALGKNKNKSHSKDILEVGEVKEIATLPHFYKSMSVLVVTSLAESFGLSVIEAAASEVPAIVLAGTASQELVIHKETGFIAFSDDEIFEYFFNSSNYRRAFL
jgi:glycosyltransferase involved in cell wall biosynthesis